MIECRMVSVPTIRPYVAGNGRGANPMARRTVTGRSGAVAARKQQKHRQRRANGSCKSHSGPRDGGKRERRRRGGVAARPRPSLRAAAPADQAAGQDRLTQCFGVVSSLGAAAMQLAVPTTRKRQILDKRAAGAYMKPQASGCVWNHHCASETSSSAGAMPSAMRV